MIFWGNFVIVRPGVWDAFFAFRFVSLVFWDPLWRHGIVSPCAKRVAAQNALCGQPKAYEKATFHKCFKSIGRACRGEPTARISFEWRKKFLIKPNQPNAHILHGVCVLPLACGSLSISNLAKAFCRSFWMSVAFLPRMASRALMTTRKPVRSSSRIGS